METRSIVEFEATLITRGGGTGAKRVMEQNPERSEFIKSVTGWERVEPGTLTVSIEAGWPVNEAPHLHLQRNEILSRF